MSYWMYHKLTDSVYPVPANTLEEVATLADTLAHRIYFEAELTTAPAVVDSYVRESFRGVFRYDDEYLWRLQADMVPGDKAYVIEYRAETFKTEVDPQELSDG